MQKKHAVTKGLQCGLAILLALSAWMPWRAAPAVALSNDVVISQVYGGGGNSGGVYTNDFIELFNRGTSTVDLTGWSLQYASTTGQGTFGSSASQITPLTGALAPGQYLLVQEATGTNTIAPLPAPDVTDSTPINMSGTGGKVALVNTTTPLGCNGGSTTCLADQLAQIVDLVGWDGADFYETAPAPATTNATAVLRANGGCTETDNNAADFLSAAPIPRNSSSAAYLCPLDEAPSVAATTPGAGAVGVAVNANIIITFSEPVSIAANPGDTWLSCGISGAHNAMVSPSADSRSFTFDPGTDFAAGELCTLSIPAEKVSDLDSIDPPDQLAQDFTLTFYTASACGDAYTPIYAIQGSGPAAAITGMVTTQGVVVGDYERPSPALRGFYLQDTSGDGDPATSDGIFVFESSDADSVSLGDVVRVAGTAGEYQDQTQISAAAISVCASGADVTPVEVSLPAPDPSYLERYEGMLVRFPQKLTVTETYQLGRFGEVLLSAKGRLAQPTNVTTPGAAAQALQAQDNLNQILVDDASQEQDPDPIVFGRGGQPLSAANTLRGGDTATDITGVMTYTWGGNSASPNAYRVRPINALNGFIYFEPANPRPPSPPTVTGTLRVAGMNLLNFFNTFADHDASTPGCFPSGTEADCRGAESQIEFDRQWAKTVSAILGTDADVVGLTELENDGYESASAIQFLVDRLNAATAAGTYAFIDADALTGQLHALGGDAIKVGLIYKSAQVTPVGVTSALNTDAFLNGGDSAPRNRAALAQAFRENSSGKTFVVSVNHFKSKGSACNTSDADDGQGNCNEVRNQAAQQLANWLAANPTGVADAGTLILGDLNSYAMEDPISTLKTAGYTNLIEKFNGLDAYSYVFDGQWGYLDHALADGNLTQQVTGVAEYHINADEPSVLDYNTNYKDSAQLTNLYSPDAFRAADHDPIIVGLDLSANRTPRVAGSIADQRVFTGIPFSLTLPVGLFHDPDAGDRLTLSATLANGNPLPAWLRFDPVTANFSGLPEPASAGSLLIKVTATDTSQASAATSFTLAVWSRYLLPVILTH